MKTGEPTAESELRWWRDGENDSYFNQDHGRQTAGHKAFFEKLLADLDVQSAAEIGCATGTNLVALSDRVQKLIGVEPSLHALRLARTRVRPDTVLVQGTVYNIPPEVNGVDFLYTYGMLIHIPDSAVDKAMQELIRVGARYVLLAEYISDKPYANLPGGGNGCWYRPYGSLFLAVAGSRYEMIRSGSGPEDGIDYCLFERCQ